MYASDKLVTAKIEKGTCNNAINTDDRVLLLAFCTSSFYRLPVDQVSLFIFNTFRDMLRTKFLLQKLGRKITVITCDSHGSCTLHFF